MRGRLFGIEFHRRLQLLSRAHVVLELHVTRAERDARVRVDRKFLHCFFKQHDRARVVVLLLRHEPEIVKDFRYRDAGSRAFLQPHARFGVFLLIEQNVAEVQLALRVVRLNLEQTAKEFFRFEEIAFSQPRNAKREQIRRLFRLQLQAIVRAPTSLRRTFPTRIASSANL